MPDVTVSEPAPDFLSHFDGMNDPRQTAKIIYPLNEIFLLVVCAYLRFKWVFAETVRAVGKGRSHRPTRAFRAQRCHAHCQP
jgi:hypothetical protein